MIAKFFTLLVLLLVSNSLFSAEFGKVIRLRGYATLLSPGAKNARVVEFGQKIYEDTSILTTAKSFVILEFKDGSKMSIGPNSKVVVMKARSGEPGLVSLLKGKIRNNIQSENNKDVKYIIRTRTAAMGVRGTEFQTSYNADNKATSLVTFKGEVAMARINSSHKELESSNVKVERDINGQPVFETSNKETSTKIEELKKALMSQGVSVENGQFAGTVAGLESPTKPVVVNPVQMKLLYNNQDLAPKRANEQLANIDFSKIKHKGSADSSFDAKTGQFTPRAGGFVDPDTALYIPPTEDSVYDEVRNIYKPKDVGFVNKSTGDYIPPKGLTLDPRLGFVTNSKNSALIASAGKLNSNIAKDILLKNIDEEPPVVRPNKRERTAFGMIGIELGPLNESHSITSDSLGSAFENNDQEGFSFLISHDHQGKDDWQAITRLGLRSVDLKTEGSSINSKSDSLLLIGAGVRHAFSPRLAARGIINLKQVFIYNHPQDGTTTTNEWTRFTIPTLELVLESEFWRTKRFAMTAEAGGLISLPKSKADVDTSMAFGFVAKLGLEYWVGRKSTLGLNFFVEQQSFDLESTRFTSTDEIARSGVQLSYQIYY